MTQSYLIDPDLNFIRKLSALEGEDLKSVINAPHVRWYALFLRITNHFLEKR